MQINLHSVHNEVEYWKDPHVFRPERHLSAEGKIIRTDHFLPFGAGTSFCSTSIKRFNNFFFRQTTMPRRVPCQEHVLLVRCRSRQDFPVLSSGRSTTSHS